MSVRRLLIVGALVLAAALAGCNRFTRQRYETLYVGQPARDVQRVLGKPTAYYGETWVYVHDPVPYYRAVILFSEGKISGKSWSYDRPPASQPAKK